jgi:hypothetical protein
MKTVKFDLYKFDELSDDVQEKVLADYKESLRYYDDGVLEDITILLEHLGFSDVTIDYSLDYSHVLYAKVSGKLSKHDLTFVKNQYKGEKLFKIVEMLDDYVKNHFDVEKALYDDNFMQLVNQMVFSIIENDYMNYYMPDSLEECLISEENDYLDDGTLFTFDSDLV